MGVDLARYTYVGRRLVRADFGNVVTLALSFDGRGHVLERAVTSATGTLWRLQQLRDAAAYTRFESAITRTGARSRKFALDSIYRLTHYHDDIAQWIDPAAVAPPLAPVDPQDVQGKWRSTALSARLLCPQNQQYSNMTIWGTGSKHESRGRVIRFSP